MKIAKKCLLMLLIAVPLFAQSGTYEGSAQGRNGAVNVAVTIADGKVTDIRVISSREDKTFVFPRMTRTIIKNNNINIDAIAGATRSSRGFLGAVEQALTTAGLDLKGARIKAEK